MTQKLFCLCGAVALLFALATVNVASAQDGAVAAVGCPCVVKAGPCQFANPCDQPIAYRVGLFGVVRPVTYAPAYYPGYCAYPGYYGYRPVVRPFVPYRAVACPPAYCWQNFAG